jgi:glycine/D-amino acid oxidase-like deaminating enzyme
MQPDVVVIGGGIVGCACMHYLSQAGLGVRLLERGALGSGASRAGMSHVVTWEEPVANLELARASQRLYEILAGELSPMIEYRRTGSLAVVESPEGLPAMAAMIARLQQWGLDCQLLNAQDLRRLEPGLAPDLAGGAFFPGDGMVNPLLTTAALARAALARGAIISTHTEVTGFEFNPGTNRLSAVLTRGERIPTGGAIIAAGAWTAPLAELLGAVMPIQPRKGNLIVTAPVPPDLLRCKVILSAGYMDSVHGGGSGVAVAANIQQVSNGNLLLGSSRQFAGFDLQVDPLVVSEIIRRCVRFFPALSGVSAVRMWAGLRPYTPDLLPVIGPLPVVSNVYIAAGHEGIGITEGPITGKLISQMIIGETPDLAVERFSPDRFRGTTVV